MGVTIKQVAREAGVSIATVSRVWTGKGPVRDRTRRHILDISRQMRYAPHFGARSLVTKRTETVGVLLPDLHGEFFSELLRAIDRTARRHGYHLLVSGFHGDPAELEAGLAATRGRVDGILALATEISPRRLEEIVPEDTPVVLLAGSPKGPPRFEAIAIDNEGGAWRVIAHLADLGHARIAFIKGPARNMDARERLRGYRRAVRARGCDAAAELELDGDFSEHSGFQAGSRMLDLRPRPTAVFAANDMMAIGALAALRERGIEVPGEVALAGFDDIPLARLVVPPLTTVRVPTESLGQRGMERLLATLEGGGSARSRPRSEMLDTPLVVRASCGANARTVVPGASLVRP